MKKRMQLIAFDENQIKEILELLGEDTSKEVIGKCNTCKKDLNIKNIGNIAKGKKGNLLFCDNPACFSSQVAKIF